MVWSIREYLVERRIQVRKVSAFSVCQQVLASSFDPLDTAEFKLCHSFTTSLAQRQTHLPADP